VVLSVHFLEVDVLPLLVARISCTDVVPEVVATGFPPSWARLVIPDAFFTAIRTLVTKVVLTKETCRCRASLLVVEPHSRSTVPLLTRGIRFWEVTGWCFTLRPGILSWVFTASTILLQTSMW